MKSLIHRRWLRIAVRTLSIFILIVVLACFVFDHFVQLRDSDEELLSFFKQHHIDGRVGYYTAHGRRLRFVSVNADTLPTLLLIHGSPSSTSMYKAYFADTDLRKKFHMLAIDRPGYGYSGLGNPETSIQLQSDMIRPLVDSIYTAHHPILVVGFSYGSSIACRFVMDHPNLADALVLIGPSLAPGEEKTYWITPYIESPALQWMVPRIFKTANTEKLAHRKELEKMLPLWDHIHVPVMYLQGANDHLIYTGNAAFARKHLINAPFLEFHFFKGRSHFIPFSERHAIKKDILSVYARVKGG